MWKAICFFAVICFHAGDANALARNDPPAAQTASTLSQSDIDIPAQPIKQAAADVVPTLTAGEHQLGLLVLGFGLVVLLLEFLHFQRLREPAAVQDVLMVYGITLIIVGALFLIVVGMSSTQIAPAFALFGTIVGYMLGKRTSANTP